MIKEFVVVIVKLSLVWGLQNNESHDNIENHDNFLKIPFSFLLFHTAFLVEVYHSGGSFRNGYSHHFLHNFLDGFCF